MQEQTTTRNELQESTDASLICSTSAESLNAKSLENTENISDNSMLVSHLGSEYKRNHTEETKQKISNKLKGRKLSEEHKKNMYHEGMKGKHHSKETREKISKGHIGLKVWNKGTKEVMKPNKTSFNKNHITWNTGKKLSREHKIKLGQSHIGQKSTKKNKTFNIFYGEEKSNKIKKKISNTLKKKFEMGDLKSPFIELRKQNKLVLPIKDTKIEVKIQGFLTKLHLEYFTHKYISEITHAYQCDIFIPEQEGINQKTIIECDGCYWHGCLICGLNKNEKINERLKLDKIRTKELQEKGFRVIRLWEHEIKNMELNNFNIKVVNDTYRPTRRRLHDTQPKRGNIREKYSTGSFKGIRKGTICEFGQIVGGTGNQLKILPIERREESEKRISKSLNKISWLSHKFTVKEVRNSPQA